MKPTLLAWHVRPTSDFGDGGHAVVFTTTELRARILGAAEVDHNGEADGFEAVRAPKFDGYAPGPVPMQALLDAGWWFTCGFCSHEVTSDGCEDCAEERELDTTPPPAVHQGDVFCSQACLDAELADRQARAEAKAAALAEVARRWPWAKVERVWEGYFDPKAATAAVGIELDFGGRAMAQWNALDPEHVRVAEVDVERWKRLVAGGGDLL